MPSACGIAPKPPVQGIGIAPDGPRLLAGEMLLADREQIERRQEIGRRDEREDADGRDHAVRDELCRDDCAQRDGEGVHDIVRRDGARDLPRVGFVLEQGVQRDGVEPAACREKHQVGGDPPGRGEAVLRRVEAVRGSGGGLLSSDYADM